MSYSVYQLYGPAEHPLDLRGKQFPFDMYSRMKHGDKKALRDAGTTIAQLMLFEGFDPQEPITLPVAYYKVKPACYYLAEAMAQVFTAYGLDARIVKIEKDSVTTTDYAASSAEDRIREMSTINFSLSEPVAGTHVVLVDDIRVTGLAEKTAVAALMEHDPLSVTTAYFAEVDPVLATSPHVEKTLNHWSIKSISDMIPVMDAGDFAITIRFTKRVLGAEAEELEQFLKNAPASAVQQVADAARATGPEFIAQYADNFAIMERYGY